jgi:hypothetical protein
MLVTFEAKYGANLIFERRCWCASSRKQGVVMFLAIFKLGMYASRIIFHSKAGVFFRVLAGTSVSSVGGGEFASIVWSLGSDAPRTIGSHEIAYFLRLASTIARYAHNF